jgi:tetratricopeptide (TPR) repeat protein
MRSPAAACAVLLALLAAGCATPGLAFRCPARGGPAWHELSSDHFVLRTDLPRDEGAALVGRLERIRAAVAAALFEQAPAVPGRVEVIAFRSADQYRSFAPEGATGYYLRYAGGPPRIVLSGEVGPTQRGLLAHELTHHFLSGVFRRQPRWFAEGLAVYLESLGEDRPGRPFRVGAPPPGRLERARSGKVRVRALLAWDGSAAGPDALDHYAASWLLVHWLIHRAPEAFAELQRRLADGAAPADAWRAALPSYDLDAGGPEALDRILAEYARTSLEGERRELPVPAVVGLHEQIVPAAEVHALRLALWSLGPPRPRAALEGEVREALEESRDHPVALQVLAGLQGGDPLPLARRAAAAHPDDPRAWTFLASALRGPDASAEREAAYRRAVELAPANPAALHNLAQELLGAGRSGEALPIARQSAQLAPWSPPLLAGYAAVLSDLGRCAEARSVQQRALDSLPERASADARRELSAGLERYAAQCRAADALLRLEAERDLRSP